jgi:hypothetical protein
MMQPEVVNFNHFSYRHSEYCGQDKNYPLWGINLSHGLKFILSVEDDHIIGKWGNGSTRNARVRATAALVSWGWYRNDGPMTHHLFNATDGKKYHVAFLCVEDPDNLKEALIQLGDLRQR